ncbi:inositol phosphatase [Malaciobacter mytili]|uniref:inositol monophosphatase family protein n=1 Tax=Malaciobacter mytili TaxID=603050 RepID=UPI00100A4740|nr:inositol monophosphatase family protein [Malaciobacter mytili]RXI43342.1 inositol phosphatase [Malaciobacter mytili]
MKAFIKDCIKANKKIYEYINTHISNLDYIYSGQIGFGGDKSLNIDLFAENIFIEYLKSYGDIFSEESGYISSNSSYKIIIDPIDGSDNFSSNLPYFGTSIALQKDNKTIIAVVCNLATGILIYKDENKKIKKLNLATNKYIDFLELQDSNIGIFERAYTNPKLCQKLYENNIKYRSLGAVALSLCDARNYSFVLFYGKIREFDIAAGVYICEDLNIYQSDKFLIVAKKIHIFNLIKDIIN